MSGYELPTSAVIGGREYTINSDWRVVLDVMGVMAQVDVSNEEKLVVVLQLFYPEYESMPVWRFEEAYRYLVWFINGGVDNEKRKKRPKLMDWQQDLPLIISPINRAIGYEVRAADYVHWWTFLAAYQEIGDCTFAQVVSIRKKRLKGKKLDKADQDFYNENKELIDFQTVYTDEENALFDEWMT